MLENMKMNSSELARNVRIDAIRMVQRSSLIIFW